MNLVPVKRRYDGSRRAAQARQLRVDVVDSARELFVTKGYAATTVADVAGAAGVSQQLVFKAFGSKRGLLEKVVDWTLAGDDEPVPMAERPSTIAVREEPTPAGKCALFARHNRLVAARIAPTVSMLRAAADVDGDARSIYRTGEAHRRTACGWFVADLAAAGPLRPGLSEDSATDAVWALAPDLLWTSLVVGAGWEEGAFEQHLAGLVAATVLEDRLLPAARRFSRRLNP
jgi:AcrR family transcriptional regulator